MDMDIVTSLMVAVASHVQFDDGKQVICLSIFEYRLDAVDRIRKFGCCHDIIPPVLNGRYPSPFAGEIHDPRTVHPAAAPVAVGLLRLHVVRGGLGRGSNGQ